MERIEYDVIILGSGPAGLQAAIHAARAKADVVVLGRGEMSSVDKAHIENYCCLSNIKGEDLLRDGIWQAEAAGAEFLREDALRIVKETHYFMVESESGREIRGRTIIFAIGVSRNFLNVPGEMTFRGYGVSYCVDCDANFYRDRPVIITGNGSAAVSGALTLIEYTDVVHLVAERLDVSEELHRQLMSSGVVVHEKAKIKEIQGTKGVERVILDTGVVLATEGVFIELGAKGAIDLGGSLGVEMDSDLKHFAVNRKQETNIPGIYAAGDICGPPWQIAKAVGEGCVAGLEAAKYAKKLR
jgi:thioredoxin reductase (NADPH)